jgi:hypothetical protein
MVVRALPVAITIGSTMRIPLTAALVLGLAACSAPEPIRSTAVGFGTADDYRAGQAAELNAVRPVGPGPVNTYVSPYSGTPVAGTIQSGPIVSGPIGAPLPGAEPPPIPEPQSGPNHSGISDEQDFSAVASRETIETDKARIEANKAQYQQIAPEALPERSGNQASPIIEYAINAPNRLGQSVYSRSGLALAAHDKACARYPNSAEAQEAFLKSGGPKRDPKNLDPDGDGFACTWDPTPFQRVSQ